MFLFFIDAATRFGHINTRIYIKQSNCVKRNKLEGLLSLHLLVVLLWICTGWCCLVCPLDTDTLNLWNEDKNHGIRQHCTLMQNMTFSCHLIFQHFAAVQSQNNFGSVSILPSVNLPFPPNPFAHSFSLRSLQPTLFW